MKIFNSNKFFFIAVAAAMLASCSNDDITGEDPRPKPEPDTQGDISINVPEGGFTVTRCNLLTIKPTVKEGKTFMLSWSVNGKEFSTADSLDVFLPYEGENTIAMTAVSPEGKDTTITVKVNVTKEEKAYSPYITSIPDYLPAPGQFVNSLPEYKSGDTRKDMNRKALEAIGNNAGSMITLGSYGGYVICGFDHTIANVPGEYDFKVLGNAFYADANPNPDAPKKGGSCEPGIVMVAYDRNHNGVADDDEWYELAGSEYNKPTTIKNYEIVYTRPSADHVAVAPPEDEAFWMTDAEYIPWNDSEGNSGYVYKNKFHSQSYYPEWISSDELSFTGTLLPNNAVDESGTGHYWVLYAYDWGYADNGLNTDDTSNFDIDWAVDSKGNKVHLPGIDFVKIYTGVNQYCGWLGETSTEVAGINDLHLLKK